jgi:hypothetical protein
MVRWSVHKLDVKTKNQASELQKLQQNEADISRLQNENEALKRS